MSVGDDDMIVLVGFGTEETYELAPAISEFTTASTGAVAPAGNVVGT